MPENGPEARPGIFKYSIKYLLAACAGNSYGIFSRLLVVRGTSQQVELGSGDLGLFALVVFHEII